jgi:hypothetical protein
VSARIRSATTCYRRVPSSARRRRCEGH